MKPTVDEIELILIAADELGKSHKEVSERIHALFNPILKPLSELENSEILEEIAYCTEQTDILADRRLSLEREMFFRNSPDVNY